MNVNEYKQRVINLILRAAVCSNTAHKEILDEVAQCVLVCSEEGYRCTERIDKHIGANGATCCECGNVIPDASAMRYEDICCPACCRKAINQFLRGNQMNNKDIRRYMQSQFRELMQPIFPSGIAWGSPWHAVLVQTFLVGAYCWRPSPNRGEQRALEKLMMEAAADDWAPGVEWQWETTNA